MNDRKLRETLQEVSSSVTLPSQFDQVATLVTTANSSRRQRRRRRFFRAVAAVAALTLLSFGFSFTPLGQKVYRSAGERLRWVFISDPETYEELYGREVDEDLPTPFTSPEMKSHAIDLDPAEVLAENRFIPPIEFADWELVHEQAGYASTHNLTTGEFGTSKDLHWSATYKLDEYTSVTVGQQIDKLDPGVEWAQKIVGPYTRETTINGYKAFVSTKVRSYNEWLDQPLINIYLPLSNNYEWIAAHITAPYIPDRTVELPSEELLLEFAEQWTAQYVAP